MAKIPAPKVKLPRMKTPGAKLPSVPKAPQTAGGLKGYATASKMTLPKNPKFTANSVSGL